MTWQTYKDSKSNKQRSIKIRSNTYKQIKQKPIKKLQKNQWKIDMKSTKNPPNKSIKNRPTIKENRCLEGVWANSSSQARFGRCLGRCLCDSGANMGPTWDPTWRQVGAKIIQKSMSKSIKKLEPLEIDFWKDFGGSGEAKWSQVGTKMASKMELILKTLKIKKTFKNQ